MPTRSELIATGRTHEEIAALIGADAVIYQELDALIDGRARAEPGDQAVRLLVLRRRLHHRRRVAGVPRRHRGRPRATARAPTRASRATSSTWAFPGSTESHGRKYKPDTLGVRAGGVRSDFQEHSEALVLSTSFVYRQRRGGRAQVRQRRSPRTTSTRASPIPRCTMFQDRLAALEGAEACVATSTGMAAITTMVFGPAQGGRPPGRRARGVFGTVVPLFDQIAQKLRHRRRRGWTRPTSTTGRRAIRPNTKLLYAESPSNPVLRSRRHRRPRRDREEGRRDARGGQRRVLARAAAARSSSAPTSWSTRPPSTSRGRDACSPAPSPGAPTSSTGPLFQFVRTAGPAISPYNAWTCLKGMETLGVRMRGALRQRARDRALARVAARRSSACSIPGSSPHPQHALAMRQQSGGGAVLSFVVKGGREARVARDRRRAADLDHRQLRRREDARSAIRRPPPTGASRRPSAKLPASSKG